MVGPDHDRRTGPVPAEHADDVAAARPPVDLGGDGDGRADLPDRHRSISAAPSRVRGIAIGGAPSYQRPAPVPSASGPWNRCAPSRQTATWPARRACPARAPSRRCRRRAAASRAARSSRGGRAGRAAPGGRRRPTRPRPVMPARPCPGAGQRGALDRRAALERDGRAPEAPGVHRHVLEADVGEADVAHLRRDELGHLMLLRRPGRAEPERVRADREIPSTTRRSALASTARGRRSGGGESRRPRRPGGRSLLAGTGRPPYQRPPAQPRIAGTGLYDARPVGRGGRAGHDRRNP